MAKIPKGLCHCGCGRPTPVASRNRKNLGRIKGEPLNYLRGHSRCVAYLASHKPSEWITNAGFEHECHPVR